MATKVNNSSTKKKSTSKKPSTEKKAPTPKPVEVEPQATTDEKAEEINVPEALTGLMVTKYLDIFSSTILDIRGQILQGIINSLYEKDETEASEEYKAALNSVIYEANQDKDIRIATYEVVTVNANPESDFAKEDPIGHMMFKSIKENLKGYDDETISVEVVSPVPGGKLSFIVFKEDLILSLAVKDNILKAMGPNAVCGLCFKLAEFPMTVIDIFRAHIAALVPSIQDEALEGALDKYVENFGSAIAGVAIRTLASLNAYFVQDPQGIFTNIVGQDKLGEYLYKCVINTTTPKDVSFFSIRHNPNAGEEDTAQAIKEA